MSDHWLEISCDIPEEFSDTVADFLMNVSTNGVSIDNRTVDAFSLNEILPSPRVTVKAYVSSREDVDLCFNSITIFIEDLSRLHPASVFKQPVIVSVNTEDWAQSWKTYFKPLRVGKRLYIVPTWEEAAITDNDLIIRIDPGMAFGTGGHETTRLCLELLEQVMDESPLLSIPSLLDLGTGSGILAMAAILLGAGRVLALDIDADAINVARENIALNEMDELIECGTTSLESITEKFDIIMANILAEELVRLAQELSSHLEPGGFLILSGILAEKEELVRRGFSDMPLVYKHTAHAGEWVALLYTREPE